MYHIQYVVVKHYSGYREGVSNTRQAKSVYAARVPLKNGKIGASWVNSWEFYAVFGKIVPILAMQLKK